MNSRESLQNVLWVVFDAVGTVIFADPPIHMAYHRIGRKHGSAVTPEEALRRFREAFQSRSAPGNGILTTNEDRERAFWWEVVEAVLPDVTDKQTCFDELHAYFARPTAWGCFVDVADTLAALHALGLKLAMASNFDVRLHSVVDGHPELASVQTRVISTEVGFKKPSPDFFRALIDRCGAEPHEILMIGDDWNDDIVAARSVGLQAIHLDRSGRGEKEAITTLEELPPLFE